MPVRRPIWKFLLAFGTVLIIALVLDLVIFHPLAGTAPSATVEATSINSTWTPQFQTFDGVEMAEVPPGCFDMGSNTGFEDEKPVTKICFDQAFWIDKTEVTQAQFKRLGGQAAHTPGFVGDNRPVESVTWFEARDFCAKRDARLPTEAEWEYAARGPDDLLYPWGDTFESARAAWNLPRTEGTIDVGSVPIGASWVGTLDMIGNVWEWTSSTYAPYPYKNDAAHEDPSNSNGTRVIRGGSWFYFSGEYLLAASRGKDDPHAEDYTIGFRCAR